MEFRNRGLIICASIKKRKRIWIKNMLLIGITITIVMITGSISKMLNSYLNDYLLGDPGMRCILVGVLNENAESTYQALAKLDSPYIVDFFVQPDGVRMEIINKGEIGQGFLENKKLSAFGDITMASERYYDKRYQVDGDWFEKGQGNVGIVPKYFSMRAVHDLQQWDFQEEYIDGQTLIGKTIQAEYYTYKVEGQALVLDRRFEYNFKVIGTYDNIKASTPSCTVLLPYDDVKNIDALYGHYDSITTDTEVETMFCVMVDEEANASMVERQLKQEITWENSTIIREWSPGILQAIATLLNNAAKYVGMAMTAICFMLILINYYNFMKQRSREIGIYKAVGYDNKDIGINLCLEVFTVGLITLVISTLVSMFILGGIYIFIKSNASIYLSVIIFSISGKHFLVGMVLAVIVPMVACIAGILQALRVQPMVAMQSEKGR